MCSARKLKKNWKIIRFPDVDGLPIALKEVGTIDLCHYDSDKSYAGRMWAYPKLWQAIKPNGIFISDDIGDTLAFKEFSEHAKGETFVIKYNNQYVGLIKKY